MIRLIFLDFDGVLNSSQFMLDCFDKNIDPDDRIDSAAVNRLNKITNQTGAHIVVSSTWRLYMNHDRLKRLFKEQGITGTFFGTTPETNLGRGEEIRSFLLDLDEDITSFVVLDDDTMDIDPNVFVKTSFDTGLLDEHVARAIKILG